MRQGGHYRYEALDTIIEMDLFIESSANDYEQSCKKSGAVEAHMGQETGQGQSSCEAEDCGKTGEQLLKCRACKLVRYCSTVCQKRNWGHHKKACGVVKVHPEMGHYAKYNINADYLTRTVTFHEKGDCENFIGKEVNMVVKIQTSLILNMESDSKPYIRVYNQTRDYDVKIEAYDKNYNIINDKILKDGLPCARVHPLLKKLYCMVHLNTDFSLDVHLTYTYNIQNW